MATHKDKHIAAAIAYAQRHGWTVIISNGHAWGILLCPESSQNGCRMSVWSTPRNGEDHARQIQRKVDKCPH